VNFYSANSKISLMCSVDFVAVISQKVDLCQLIIATPYSWCADRYTSAPVAWLCNDRVSWNLQLRGFGIDSGLGVCHVVTTVMGDRRQIGKAFGYIGLTNTKTNSVFCPLGVSKWSTGLSSWGTYGITVWFYIAVTLRSSMMSFS